MFGALSFITFPRQPALLGRPGIDLLRSLSLVALGDASRRAGAPTFEVSATPLGAPEASDGWHVSKTHTAGFAAAAISRAPLGIDAEWIHRPRLTAAQESARRSELDLLGVRGQPDASSLVLLWTGKEAVLKKLGLGLTGLSRCRLVGSNGMGELRYDFDGTRHEVVAHRLGDYWLSTCSLVPLQSEQLHHEEAQA